MEKIFISKRRGLCFLPVTVKIDNNEFQLGNGEMKEISLPTGKYDLIVKGLFGSESRDKIEINDFKSTIEIKEGLTTEVSLIGISIVLLIFTLMYIGLVSALLFWIFILICNGTLLIYNVINRKKYFKFKIT